MNSPSMVLGQSYLPVRSQNVATFVAKTALAIKTHPDVAAEITLAATDRLLEQFQAPADLRNALSRLVSESCRARDLSLRA